MPRSRDDGRDRDLFAQLVAGRPEALAELYDRHATALFRHALALVRRRAEAEDLVQTVFVKLATTDAELLGVRTPASYLHRMVHTAWLDARTRQVTGGRVTDHVTSGAASSTAPTFDAAIDLERALDELPEEQREVIVLHLVDGFSFREVGRLTGVSMFTAAARHRLAIRKMRLRLGQRGRADETN